MITSLSLLSRFQAFLLLLCGIQVSIGQAQTKLLRFPDIHGDFVVFCHGGDIWRAASTGGSAVRLTAHPGQELFPKISPDGRWIAFTGQYDGDEQVYIVSAGGGEPKQLTYYPARGPLPPRRGPDNQVYGWTPDGKSVLFRSYRDADHIRTLTALYTVSTEGGLPVALPMPTAGAGDLSSDGKQIVYSPLFRDFRTWKRYQGGWAQNLYVFDLKTHEAKLVAESPRTERDPMWVGGRIAFVSDRTGTLNLFTFDAATGAIEQLTQSTRWDVRWASSDGQRQIVYELDGELEVYDLAGKSSRRLSIHAADDGLWKRESRNPAGKNIESFELSPKGERALFSARGDIFTAPIEKGNVRNLTESPGAHDKHAVWSPDGARIAFVSDASGEEQIWLADQLGAEKPKQITQDHRAMLYAPAWSPDSKRVAYSDKDGKLFMLTLDGARVVEIVDAPRGGIFDYTWAPGSGHLAFSMNESNGLSGLHIWDAAKKKLHRVTDASFDCQSPSWDPEGQFLFYVSTREFAPQISTVEWNFAGNRSDGIYGLALRKGIANPFAPQSDEVATESKDKDKDKDEDKKDKADKDKEKEKESGKEKKPIEIDYEGLADRVVRVPVSAENIGGIHATKGHVFYKTSGASFYGRESYEKSKLQVFAFKERESSVFSADAGDWSVSADGLKILVVEQGAHNLYDAKPKAKDKKTVSTGDLQALRIPAQEWPQIFNEVWRRYRDFFYVRNMHGHDWSAIGDQYRQWLPHVAHRSDLNYVLGEMVSELNVGHAYIEGGDFQIPERAQYGLPGARFELDQDSGRYRIAAIFRGHNEEEKYRSPLTEVGVDAQEGDYVLAIDGHELVGSDNPYRLLRHKKHSVTLTLNSKPTLKGTRKTSYKPVASEANLLYLNQVLLNAARVEKIASGRVGYLHVPDMGPDGIYEFIKWFYPQIRKQGLVVDVRSNGGGNVSQWLIERLDNKLLGTRFGYDSKEPGTYPGAVFHGHMVCLINETSASDGDIFPHRFRQAGLGPLIGKRTWGGVVGISGRGPLMDGGQVSVPLNATNDPEGNWIIEGEGVAPDQVVENDPASVIAGRDPQLERGIEEVLNRMRDNPKRLPGRPADPVKTK